MRMRSSPYEEVDESPSPHVDFEKLLNGPILLLGRKVKLETVLSLVFYCNRRFN